MSKRERSRAPEGIDPGSSQDDQTPELQPSGDPNAGFPGTAHPEDALGNTPPPGPAPNEPDGDASGRPGSATTPETSTASVASAGRIRVKALQTCLVDGIAHHQGEEFSIDEKEFERRSDRAELERLA
jgi:hypothetical protein